MSGIREEFEASMRAIWLKTEGPFTDLMFERRPDDEYVQQVTRECWKAWQASRAALKVELPEPVAGSMSLVMLGDVRFALQQAGIEVK